MLVENEKLRPWLSKVNILGKLFINNPKIYKAEPRVAKRNEAPEIKLVSYQG